MPVVQKRSIVLTSVVYAIQRTVVKQTEKC